MKLLDRLDRLERKDMLRLVHFHLGSQITDIRYVKAGLEEIGRVGRVLFINDSKATNADSTDKALASFPGDAVARSLVNESTELHLTGGLFVFPAWLVLGLPPFAGAVTTLAAVYPARTRSSMPERSSPGAGA